MRSFKLPDSFSKRSAVAALCIIVVSCIAALARADWHDTTLPRIESELREQSRQLSLLTEQWASLVKGRADFALFKIQNARFAASPAVENMHIQHACQALNDERTLLIEIQNDEKGELLLVEKLIEQTFAHREALGCRE